ncbi:bifunctional diaminohydroxyphosphoribosylaminopyrimidine deaminase/5-amino-6-(5-phosphoribosylamino)uracil reductase RibD [Xylanibacillus composti]
MRLALQMAEAAVGQTEINPNVGCVVVKEGRIVGLGAHLQRGMAHAEVHALNMAGEQARDATVYVTLEPCSHHGRTPPCADRLIRERVARVVVAATDPNPQVAGRGIARLREHGIAVTTGVLEHEARRLIEPFAKYMSTGRPYVTLKTASTLDGKIASATGDSKWITGESARAFVHTLRHRHHAIMAGIGTVLEDDPQLNTRLPVPGLHPVRIIVDSQLRLPPSSRVVQDRSARTVVLASDQAPAEKQAELERLGVEVLRCGEGPRVDLAKAMDALGRMEIGSILLEGGGRLNGSMLEQQLIDYIYLFFAPKLIGGNGPGSFDFSGFARMHDAIRLEQLTCTAFGTDFCISGKPIYGNL